MNRRTYRATLHFMRSTQELENPVLAWARDDVAFFAAGACHILAWAFVRLYPMHAFEIVHLRAVAGYPGNHVYVSDGLWAFDFWGWTPEHELLAVTRASYEEAHPGWEMERLLVEEELEVFCEKNRHRLPSQYPFPVWPRAFSFLKQHEPPS